MRASGNGLPEVCAENLLRTFRGEVPYSRIKGIDPRNFDRPSSIARADIEADAIWVIDTYEPRVTASDIVTSELDTIGGDFNLSASVVENEA